MFRSLVGMPVLWLPSVAYVFPLAGTEWLPMQPLIARAESEPLSEEYFWELFADRGVPPFPEPFSLDDRRRRADFYYNGVMTSAGGMARPQ
ncbi:hypothetical protein ABEG18_14665 [Alsobacter sp. KACC 23698]|uniref:Uncharacterized protein n=1 Tax=Alsobacter sp. KACC 23698 TaxID=3149229 RepID=A0AAU7JA02_9HYPH